MKNLSDRKIRLPGVRWDLQPGGTVDLSEHQTSEMLRSRTSRTEIEKLIRWGKITVVFPTPDSKPADEAAPAPEVPETVDNLPHDEPVPGLAETPNEVDEQAPDAIEETPAEAEEAPADVTEPTAPETPATDEFVAESTEQSSPEPQDTPAAEDAPAEVPAADSAEPARKGKGRKGKHAGS